MTPLGDILRSMAAGQGHAGPIADEYAKQQAAVVARAAAVLRETGCSRGAAWKVALFSLGGWAQRFPDAPHDLGEQAALFIAGWCAARAVFPGDDQMHAALAERRALALAERAGVASGALPDVGAALARAKAAMAGVAAKMAKDAPRPMNRHERRQAASRRWRG